MDDKNDNPSDAAERLEHALERIALAMATSMQHAPDPAPADPDTGAQATEVRVRLDRLIDKLRSGLAERAG